MYKLFQGVKVPCPGLGTWQLKGNDAIDGVRDALEIGYRHIDTAEIYGNEPEVGQGIKDSGLPRETIFLTTKVWRDDLSPKQVKKSCENSLRKLKTEYVDLLLIHWPNEDYSIEHAIEALYDLKEAQKALHIGVSNFPAGLLERALKAGPILCDQVEYHPGLHQTGILEICKANNLMLTAYSPLGKGKILENKLLTEIAGVHNKTPGQVALRWLLQQDAVIPIPKSSSHRHRAENFDLFDFELSADEMGQIFDMGKNQRLIDPDFAPKWDQ